MAQPRRFGLEEILGEEWLEALGLRGYAARRRKTEGLWQLALFSSR